MIKTSIIFFILASVKLKNFYSLFFALYFLFFTLYSINFCVAQTQSLSIRLTVPITASRLGQSSGKMAELFNEICTALTKKTGVSFKFQPILYTEQYNRLALDALKNGNTEFALINPTPEFIENQKEYFGVAKPAFSFTIDKKERPKVCLYVRKSDNVKTIQDLKGKKWAGYDYVATRMMFYKAGIDLPLSKFFGSGKFLKSYEVTTFTDMLIEKKIDSFLREDFEVKYIKNAKPEYKDIVALDCDYALHNPIVFYRKGLDEILIENMKKILYGANKDKDFEKIKLFFIAINGKFVPFSDKEMEVDKKLVKEYRERGWLKEQDKFIEIGKF